MMDGMYGFGVGSIFMVVFWIVLVGLGIFLLIKYMNGENNQTISREKKTPIKILKERLAMGEIDEVEYERLKLILEKDEED